MMPDRSVGIEVMADWHTLRHPAAVGLLSVAGARGRQVVSFSYDAAWLKGEQSMQLDPSLQLFPGHQYVAAGQPNFGVFLDSSPDRWGRLLMRRREAQLAREEKRPERTLMAFDYLLGVYDRYRMGGLRLRRPNGPYLSHDEALASPPWTSLRHLEEASLGLEQDGHHDRPQQALWLKMLLAPGASLGGARPKAGVLDPKGHLWLAKFPSHHDSVDIGAWEFVVHALARKAQIDVAAAMAKKFNTRHHTFLSRRFDRAGTQGRIHYASAMTLLQRRDGDDAAGGASYLELAALIMRAGQQAALDLQQLWRRIVFSMAVSNCDDHLRNHGFLLGDNGWRLAPAFDMNPFAEGNGLKLNVSETDNAQDFALALDVAPFFRLKATDAKKTIAEVKAAVRTWRQEANRLRIPLHEQSDMARAFRCAE